jgi:gag-polypeptide of LTR copia-type
LKPDELAYKKWDVKDMKAGRIIGFTVIDELQGPVQEAGTSKEVWDQLEMLHALNDRQRQCTLTR